MPVVITALPSDKVRALRSGAPDAYGCPPEVTVSDGPGNPCRHCLRFVRKGRPMLVLAHRPFPALQPYAETGPIFLHSRGCERAAETDVLPELFGRTAAYIVRGYDAGDRIIYGTGAVVPTADIPGRAAELLARGDVAYLHMRSAKNNCYQCRIERG
jgi:hypothetical protein